MTNYHFIDDSQILLYASSAVLLVQVIDRLMNGGEITGQDKEVVKECTKFIDQAMNGQEIVYGRAAALIPDAGSVEIYGYVISMLGKTGVEDTQLDEYSRKRLLESRQTLEKISAGTITRGEDRSELNQTRRFFSNIASLLVAEMAGKVGNETLTTTTSHLDRLIPPTRLYDQSLTG